MMASDLARGLRSGLPSKLVGFFVFFLSINGDGHSKERAFVVPIFAGGREDCMRCC
jgi:hypothetical protein